MAERSAANDQPLYFINRWVDYAVIGGASLVTFFALKYFHDGSRTQGVIATATVLVWCCNWPHFAATNFRLYHSRENINQYPMTAWVIPVLILFGIFSAFAAPEGFAPFWVKIFLIWSPYHFSGQSLGISMLYARRSGLRMEKWERFVLSSFIFSTFLYPTIRGEAGTGMRIWYTIQYPGLGLPSWMAEVAKYWMWATGLVLLAVYARWCLRQQRLVPLIVLLPAATQLIWFVVGARVASFTEFVPFFHGLQYMLIAWAMQLKEKMDLEGIEPSRRYVATESLLWGGMVLVLGAALFALLPWLLARGMGTSLMFATGVVIAGVQIHHFFVDGVIWKLKRKSVSSPLMVNISDMIERPRPEAG